MFSFSNIFMSAICLHNIHKEESTEKKYVDDVHTLVGGHKGLKSVLPSNSCQTQNLRICSYLKIDSLQM